MKLPSSALIPKGASRADIAEPSFVPPHASCGCSFAGPNSEILSTLRTLNHKPQTLDPELSIVTSEYKAFRV